MVLSRWKWLVPGAAMLAFTLFAGAGGAIAQQAPPSARFYGTITVNGANGPTGAVVTALVGGTICGTSSGAGNYNGTQYFVDVQSSPAPCAVPGASVTFQVNGQQANETGTIPPVSSAVQLNLTVGGAGAAGSVTYQAGWNLVGAPTGTVFAQAANPLYAATTTSGGSYVSVPNTQGVTGGQGYWAYFAAPTTVSLSGTSANSVTVTAPAGVYIMVGNPSATRTVTVSGADVVYTYTPAGGYTASAVIPPGQGAWVYSAAGATITIQ